MLHRALSMKLPFFFRRSDIGLLTHGQKPRLFWILLRLSKHDIRPEVGRKGRAEHQKKKHFRGGGCILHYFEVPLDI